MQVGRSYKVRFEGMKRDSVITVSSFDSTLMVAQGGAVFYRLHKNVSKPDDRQPQVEIRAAAMDEITVISEVSDKVIKSFSTPGAAIAARMEGHIKAFSTIAWDAYRRAEAFADEYAGDTGTRVAVVEDFTQDVFLVMPLADADRYIEDHDAEIQYEAGLS